MECPQCASLDMHVIVYREREATTRHCVCPDCRFEMWDEYGPWRIQTAPLDAQARFMSAPREVPVYIAGQPMRACAPVIPDCTISEVPL